MTGPRFLLYGANGYTGRLIAREAVAAGLDPIAAGRNGLEVAALAREYNLDHRVFALDESGPLERALGETRALLNAAGPFSRTAPALMDACIRTGTHYLDITGEIGVFEQAAARWERARAARVMLLPGIGFDVAPSDCLAAHLKRRFPIANRLTLAFEGSRGGLSRGTAITMIENISRGGAVRRDRRIVSVPAAWKVREVDFGDGPVTVTTIPWGDVSTAYYSTGIPDIEVYTRVSRAQRRLMVASRHLGWLLGSKPVQRRLKERIRRGKPGPTKEELRTGESRLWGEVRDVEGGRMVSRMRTPDGYALTAMTAVAIMLWASTGRAPIGFQTPSMAYGADWILELPGVFREDVL